MILVKRKTHIYSEFDYLKHSERFYWISSRYIICFCASWISNTALSLWLEHLEKQYLCETWEMRLLLNEQPDRSAINANSECLDCPEIITLRVNWLDRKSSVDEKIQCKRHIMKLHRWINNNDKKIKHVFRQTTKCNVNLQHCIFCGNGEIISFDFSFT